MKAGSAAIAATINFITAYIIIIIIIIIVIIIVVIVVVVVVVVVISSSSSSASPHARPWPAAFHSPSARFRLTRRKASLADQILAGQTVELLSGQIPTGQFLACQILAG